MALLDELRECGSLIVFTVGLLAMTHDPWPAPLDARPRA